ncbi:molybdate ABC transporter substrate-binding protein [Vibrio atypicus]|uniref:molybdate ABC transporter substrate-binding protein n=1 Tax=Vibrio atypicus TaxID=558271 RepID=UPI003735A64F
MNLVKYSLIPLLTTISFSASAAEKLMVYAASSMTNAVNELVSVFEHQHDVDVTTVYAGSSSLARQLVNGAPADIFISANNQWMDYLKNQEIVSSDNVTQLATNQLVVVAPIDRQPEFEITSAKSWLNSLENSRLAIGQPNAVPAGMYAKQSLENLKVWKTIQSKLAPTNNVRIALTLVERKEAALGIVYKTDALYSKKVKQLAALPESSHQPIVYPMAILNKNESTKMFATFAQSPQASNILKKYGFN